MIGLYSANSQAITSAPFTFGNALQFDGTDDFVTFGGSNVLADPSAAWSFGGWFNLSSFSNNYPVIARLRSGVTNNPFGILYSNQAQYSDLSFGSNSTFARGKVSLTPTGQYNHIIITYNGLGSGLLSNFKVYVNGSISSLNATGGFASSTDLSRLSEAGLTFNGKQDEVAFWQQELTSGQVSNLYNSGNGNFANVDVEPLVWFRMNETSGASTAVNSGSGGATYDGTLNNFNTSTCWVAH